jgi:putative membrane protein
MWWGNGMGSFGWFLMILNALAHWALVVILGMALVRGFGPNKPPTAIPGNRDALDILDERFARGEIDADEYQTRQEMLPARAQR